MDRWRTRRGTGAVRRPHESDAMPFALRMPTSPRIEWGRRLALLAGLLLLLSPFFTWAQFPFFGATVWVPGILLYGCYVFAIGIGVVTALAFNARYPSVFVLLGICSAAGVLYQRHLILTRTDETLQAVQASISSALWHLSPFRLVPTGWLPPAYLGVGLALAFFASCLLIVAGIVELLGYTHSKGVFSLVVGRPRCRNCRGRVDYSMDYCPSCGQQQMPGRSCPACGQWLQTNYVFCTACGRQ